MNLNEQIWEEYNTYVAAGNRDPAIMYLGKKEYDWLVCEIHKDYRFELQGISTSPMRWNGMYVLEVRWPSHIGFGS